jgi:hypothetical protein
VTTTSRKTQLDRVAFDFDETAQKFGRDRTWVYRQVKKGNLQAITGYGKMMIAASEIERVINGKGAAR